MDRNSKEELELVYDLIKLAKQSKMAFKYLLNEVEVIPFENFDEDSAFNQDDFSFHPNGECGCITLDDDYIFGIRCNHLIWYEGECEIPECDAIMVCGNHKGIFVQKLIVFHDNKK